VISSFAHLLGASAAALTCAITFIYLGKALNLEELLLLLAKRGFLAYILFWFLGACAASLIKGKLELQKEQAPAVPQEREEEKPQIKPLEKKEEIPKDIEPEKIAEAVRTFMSEDRE
jgi:hypothetical protein